MDSFEIARPAGVSRRSVTRVLNNPESVHPKTREKVLRVIRETNYHPNAAAKKLSSKKTNFIGVFIVQDSNSSRIFTDDYVYGPVIGAIVNAASLQGYRTITSIIDFNDDTEALKLFAEKSIDGGIFISWTNIGRPNKRLSCRQ